MKERPILFSAPMVRAILAGHKTQTRRVAKNLVGFSGAGQPLRVLDGFPAEYPCPYGQPGDQLWVRETWARDSEDGALFYRADVGSGNEADDWQICINNGDSGYRWRPSIHMPRLASRIQLEITAVRVERLNDISYDDAIAEGWESKDALGNPNPLNPISWYHNLWSDINGAGSWAANPWVWVVEFKVLKGGA